MVDPVRSLLDSLYKASGLAAALALIAILGLVTAQMVARWAGLIFPGGAQ